MNDMKDVDFHWWWGFALSVYTLMLGIVVWLRKPGEAAGEAVNKLRDDVMRELRHLGDRMSGEVADLRSLQDKLEERVEHMPDLAKVEEVAGDVKEVRAKIDGLVDTQRNQTRVLDRIETFLLNRGSK